MSNNSEIDILGFKSQGLDNKFIADTVGCEITEVPALIEKALVQQFGETNIPSAVLIELNRVDRLIARMFDDLDSCNEDTFCEFSGKMTRDAYKTRLSITDTIRKLVESKVKLMQLALVYKVSTEEKVEATVDVNSMSLAEKLDKFRNLLEDE